MRFEGRTALVTGAARGIGAATARLLAAEGAAVVLGDIDEAAARETADAIVDEGGTAVATALDVADTGSWQECKALVHEAFGRLDIAVNNAYVVVPGPAGELAEPDWERQIAVDLGAVYHCVRAFVDDLTAPDRQAGQAGALVNVSSVHALISFPGNPAYAAAKGGVLALSRQLAVEYGPRLRCNAVVPGPIETAAWDRVDDASKAESARATALGRLGRPEEVAAVIAFLASDDAAYVTASYVVVDGGQTAVHAGA